MKKILASLLVLALCAPLYADGEVTFSAVDNGADVDIIMTVNTADAGDGPVGIALDVDKTSGTLTDAVMVDSFFDILIDYAYDLETDTPGSYTYGAGTSPIAKFDEPGEDVVTSDPFCISAGGLGGESGTPADPPGGAIVLCKISGDAGSTATITANAIRGGAVVFKAGGDVTVNGLPLLITIPSTGCTEFPCCVDYNLTKKKDGGTDPLVNTNDLNSFVNYVLDNRPNPDYFRVPPAAGGYDADYNFDDSSVLININDLNAMVNFVLDNRPDPDYFRVNCNLCGC